MLVSREDKNKFDVFVTSKYRASPCIDWSKQTFRSNNSNLKGLLSSVAPLDPPDPPPALGFVSFKHQKGRYGHKGPVPDTRNYEPFSHDTIKNKKCSVRMSRSPGRNDRRDPTLPDEDNNETYLDMNYVKNRSRCGIDFKRTASRRPLFQLQTSVLLNSETSPKDMNEYVQEGEITQPAVSQADVQRHVVGINMKKAVSREKLENTFNKTLPCIHASYDAHDDYLRRNQRVAKISKEMSVSRTMADRLHEKERRLTAHCSYNVKYNCVLRGLGTTRSGSVMPRERYRRDAHSLLLSASADIQRSSTSMGSYKSHSPSTTPV
eukprot:PhF_6_TR14077/c0_g1_i2/m.22484